MAIANRQSQLVAHGTGLSSATASGDGYASNTLSGSLLVLVVWATGSSSTGTAPTISTPVTSGFTWTLAQSNFFNDGGNLNGGRCSIYYIANAGAMSSSTSTSVTATKAGSSPSSAVEFACYEFSGVTTSSPLDQTAGKNSQTGTPVDAGSLVTLGTALIFAACITEDAISTGSGFTAGISSSTVSGGRSQYILNQTSGTIDTAFGSNGGDYWGASAVDFLAATGVAVTRSQAFTFGF